MRLRRSAGSGLEGGARVRRPRYRIFEPGFWTALDQRRQAFALTARLRRPWAARADGWEDRTVEVLETPIPAAAQPRRQTSARLRRNARADRIGAHGQSSGRAGNPRRHADAASAGLAHCRRRHKCTKPPLQRTRLEVSQVRRRRPRKPSGRQIVAALQKERGTGRSRRIGRLPPQRVAAWPVDP